MITVAELKQQRIDTTTEYLDTLSKDIADLNLRGYNNMRAELTRTVDPNRIIQVLESAGFSVTRHSGFCRGESWDYLNIKWLE